MNKAAVLLTIELRIPSFREDMYKLSLVHIAQVHNLQFMRYTIWLSFKNYEIKKNSDKVNSKWTSRMRQGN